MARSMMWQLASADPAGPWNRIVGTDDLVSLTGIAPSTAIRIDQGDGVILSRTTLTAGPLIYDNFDNRAGVSDINGLAVSTGQTFVKRSPGGRIQLLVVSNNGKLALGETDGIYNIGPDLGDNCFAAARWGKRNLFHGVYLALSVLDSGQSLYYVSFSGTAASIKRSLNGAATTLATVDYSSIAQGEERDIKFMRLPGGVFRFEIEGGLFCQGTDPSPLPTGPMGLRSAGTVSGENQFTEISGGYN